MSHNQNKQTLTDQELVQKWCDQPAPLLPILHAFHDRDGFVSESAMRTISLALKIPLAELFGTVSFYHHLSQSPPGQSAPRVCDGPVCRLRGSRQLLAELSDQNATQMPCAGRCDDFIPVLKGSEVLIGTTADNLQVWPSPLPPPNPGQTEECVFSQIRQPNRSTVLGYRQTGGYDGFIRMLDLMRPADVIHALEDSQLAGRGGASFPTGLKWKTVAEEKRGPKTIVCNADEGEPGCFKDRAIMDYDPHAVIEGMLIAAYATGAKQGFIYLRYEYPETLNILAQAIEEAQVSGFLGDSILGSDFDFQIHIRRGAGSYICGEETALLNSLEGKRPFPRNRPPYPVTNGFQDLPTAVNNVETLASVPQILRNGAEWYRGLGLNGHAGTKIISLSGDIQYPGNYEIPIGLPLSTLLYDWAGGATSGREVQAVTMAGVSGGFLAKKDLDVKLDNQSVTEKGSILGSGGVIVFDDSRNMVEVAANAMEFFAEESCGKCFPCRIGTQRLTERLTMNPPIPSKEVWLTEVKEIGQTMKATSACGLGSVAPLITDSLINYFPDQIETYLDRQE